MNRFITILAIVISLLIATDLIIHKLAGDSLIVPLSQIEKIRKYIVVSEPFSTDNGMFTATMKIRRHKVREAFGETLDALY